ncbi:putative transcription factor kapC [Ceratocystis fimbriata CBS 114723]|uniref:Putative transcription factor kapC n=1 Tax=Ceratocystis fimbriata CBS 114723 TaxID=1035309 RepID=A0A2C5WXZ6_9PEZI|nr:putative transcription factor kapC [Ceratocystis fimbriata CBS 114723]
MSFEEYNNSNAEPESQLRANMELLQSLAQGAQPEDQSNSNSNSSSNSNSNNSQQQQQQQASSPSLSNIAAQASRAAALAVGDRRENGPAATEGGTAFLHPHLRSPDAVQPQLAAAAAASSIPVSVATVPVSVPVTSVAAPVPEAALIPSGMSIPTSTTQIMPVQASLTSPVGVPMDMSVDMDEGGVDSDLSQNLDGRHRVKRELSTTKRAAQNRAAQRAFRQRKENHIRKLEIENANYAIMEKRWKDIEAENHSLREYCMHIQRRLLDLQGKCPPPPVSLTDDHSGSSGVSTSTTTAPATAVSAPAISSPSPQGDGRSAHIVAAQVASEAQARTQAQAQASSKAQATGESIVAGTSDATNNPPSLDQVAQAVAGLEAAGRQPASQSPTVA